MLQMIASDIKRHYYDPNLHDLDWDAIVTQTKHRIDESSSFDEAIGHIAAAVDTLNDSHTVLLPPQTVVNASHGYVHDWRALVPVSNLRHDYGWGYEIIGERCFITRVRPGSDAEKKGLHVGDEILSINGYHPERATIQKAEYVLNVLRPQTELKLEAMDPTGVKRRFTVAAKVEQVPMMSQFEQGARSIRAYEDMEHLFRPRVAEFGGELEVIKVPNFLLSLDAVQGLIAKARKHKALIIDLRGNHGGSEETLQFLLGGILDHEVKIGEEATRSGRKPLIAKSAHNTFDGKVIVLIDSTSMSAAELFSRVLQVEKRGVVMGDRSAGMVMGAKTYHYQVFGAAVYYGVSIAEADMVMSDGKSLERIGVTPDEIMIPTASDLAQGLDPVLAHAAETLGVKLSPEAAGKLFPYEWSQ